MNKKEKYIEFLKSKICIAPETGLEVLIPDIIFKDGTKLKPHQRDAIRWAIKGGRRALFESFGLGKTIQQLLICIEILKVEGGKAIIVCPLGVRQEFKKDAKNKLGIEITYIKTQQEADAMPEGSLMITNYERIRDGNIDPKSFTVTSLDEASVLRSYGSKTYQTFLEKFKGVRYKFVCTATPSPNKYKELIHYAGYLEVMDTGQALTRFFQRDSTKANNLTLYPHKEKEFWFWLSTWALFITKPSDLGYSDEGYDLPGFEVIYHPVKVDHTSAGCDDDGQAKMFRDSAIGLKDAAKEKRDSIPHRIEMMQSIIVNDPDSNYLIWHNLESERHEIMKALPPKEYNSAQAYGSQDLEEREQTIVDFSEGRTKYLATKPSISGSGCNFQYHCHKAIFLGIGYEFNDFIQAIHRILRFQQIHFVEIHIIYAESEGEILKALEHKWKQHNYLVEQMTNIMKENGLSSVNADQKLLRSLGLERRVESGKFYEVVNNDCTIETMCMDTDSVDLIHTSIPFSNHYEYTPSYNDFGHNEGNIKFFEQMDFLTPELLRVLRPGRLAVIHVKDRILFGNATGTGMPTVDPFSDMTVFHFIKSGFQYMGRITIETDVVRENNQTYRLGWTEKTKDGTKMGVGCPEYLLLFRKLPSDTSKAYADVPVVKTKAGYNRGQWQIDARAKWNSSGERFLTPDELHQYPIDRINKYFGEWAREMVYNYDAHVGIARSLDKMEKLPATFETLKIPARTPWVWDDINRMITLNSKQTQKKLQNHVCLMRGSLVLTKDGYKAIEELSLGDLVLTHKGNWKPVIAKKCTGINPTIQTKGQGVPFLITTPEHKLWVRKTDKARAKDYMVKTDPYWIEAKESDGGWCNLKLPNVETSNLTSTEWWIVGRYLADGHVDCRGQQYFISVGNPKVDNFLSFAKIHVGSSREQDGCIQYGLKGLSDNLKYILNKCGRGAENKQVPIEGICLDNPLSEFLLSGYLSGDGNKTGNQTSASSVSRALLLGMAMVAQRARKVIPSVFASKKAGNHVILGRTVQQKKLWVMSWRNSVRHQYGEILEDGAWKKISKHVETGENETWSIQVEDDTSYTAEGCIVKNCPLQFDIVDRVVENWSNPGELVYDPFGGIMTVPYRAVKLGRKGKACELNPDYFRDGLCYLRAIDTEVQSPTLLQLMEL